jgi:hypothetical protein
MTENVMFLGKPPFKHKTKILASCLGSVCFYGAEFCYWDDQIEIQNM